MNENKASSSGSSVIASCMLLTISIEISRSTRDGEVLNCKDGEMGVVKMGGCVHSRPPFIVFAQNEHGDLPRAKNAN